MFLDGSSEDRRTNFFVREGSLRLMQCCLQVGNNYFRVHPKGLGVICMREEGLPALTFVEEYLGEVHTPSRWYEIRCSQSLDC